jgi:hypothetical protein
MRKLGRSAVDNKNTKIIEHVIVCSFMIVVDVDDPSKPGGRETGPTRDVEFQQRLLLAGTHKVPGELYSYD